MKKNICRQLMIMLLLLLCLPTIATAQEAPADTPTEETVVQPDLMTLVQQSGYTISEAYQPQSAIIIDASTGQILWQAQPNLAWYPASIVKMMTVYLVLDAISANQFQLDTLVTATERDAAISQIYALSNTEIVAGVQYSVRDLLYMTVLASSNVATVMLSDLVCPNNAADFVALMNQKARELGMNETTFYNCSGATASAFEGHYMPTGIDPNAENVSTAKDLALLFYHLLQTYPDVLTYTSPAQLTVMADTPYAQVLDNHNDSIPGLTYGYEGVDGLKTGSSPFGAFSYAATAQRGEMRLIEVVLGVGNWEDPFGAEARHLFGNALFDYGFSQFSYQKVLAKGKHVIDGQTIQTTQDLYSVVPANQPQPIFSLTEQQTVQMQTSLAQIDATIAAPHVAYQKEEKPKPKPAETKTSTSVWQTLDSTLLAMGALFVASLLALGILHGFQKRRKSFALSFLKIVAYLSLLVSILALVFLLFK